MKVGLAVSIYNRPDTFTEWVDHAIEHLVGVVDHITVTDDWSDEEYRLAHSEQVVRLRSAFPHGNYAKNHETAGHATAKATGMGLLLSHECDWIFCSDDDLFVTSPKAITGYIEAMERSGYGHLAFHHTYEHASMDTSMVVAPDPSVTVWPFHYGSWMAYRADALRECGLPDLEFGNTWGHVEHTVRLSLAGYCTPDHHQVPDATGSEEWFRGSGAPSTFRNAGWYATMAERKEYWRTEHPDTYHEVFEVPLATGERPPLPYKNEEALAVNIAGISEEMWAEIRRPMPEPEAP